MTTKELVNLIVEGGGAGIVAWWCIGQWIKEVPEKWRRIIAWLVTAAIALAATGLGLLIPGVLPVPESPKAWSDLLVRTVAVAITVSQIGHSLLPSPDSRR